jgi:hypothetical protein
MDCGVSMMLWGGEQVLASNEDWIVYLRAAARAAEGACGASSDRVLVAIHHDGKSSTSAASTIDVKIPQTWMEGCQLDAAVIHTNGSSGLINGNLLQLKANGDAVWIAACQ